MPLSLARRMSRIADGGRRPRPTACSAPVMFLTMW